MKVLAIIQARLGSTRFPNKVMQKLGNKTIIQILIERLSKTKLIFSSDLPIIKFNILNKNCKFFNY